MVARFDLVDAVSLPADVITGIFAAVTAFTLAQKIAPAVDRPFQGLIKDVVGVDVAADLPTPARLEACPRNRSWH